MKTEYEVRVLEIDKEQLVSKLEELGAKKEGEYFQRRYVYDFIPKRENEWIRLRTNGFKTTLTYKNIKTGTIDGTEELEIEVSDFEDTNKLLEVLGYKNKGFQENKRIRYILDNVEVDIDTWPMIPTYIEIEGNSEKEILNIINRLGIDKEKITTLDVQAIYTHYGYDLEETRYLKLEE